MADLKTAGEYEEQLALNKKAIELLTRWSQEDIENPEKDQESWLALKQELMDSRLRCRESP